MTRAQSIAFLLLMLSPLWASAAAAGAVVSPQVPDPTEVSEAVPEPEERRSRIGHLHGRHRIELRFGYADNGGAGVQTSVGGVVTSYVGAENFSVGGGYSYWFRPDLAVSLTGSALDATVDSSVGNGVGSEVRSVASVQFGLRKDFLGSAEEPRLRPYLTASVGPYIGSSTFERVEGHRVTSGVRTEVAFGGHVGGGLDVQISRLIMLGGRVGFSFMSDFSAPIGGRENYGGIEAGISLSFLLGKGAQPYE
jgi:hypothetical protein